MMKQKLVSSSDVFDAQGFSTLTNAHLVKRISELEAQVERLTRLLAAQIRARQLDDRPGASPTLN